MSILDDTTTLRTNDKAWGWLEAAVPNLADAKRYNATSIDCPNPECGSAAGEACTGRRICKTRMELAVSRMRAGELPEAPGPEPVKPCEACANGPRTRQNRPTACSDDHRCDKVFPTGHRCSSAVPVPGDQFCIWHKPRTKPRFN